MGTAAYVRGGLPCGRRAAVSNMAEKHIDLADAELEVLKVLWDVGPSPVRDVLETLHRRGRRLAYTTVQTLLTRLEQKGFAVSDKSEFAYIYRAKVSRNRVTKARLKTLVRQLYDGAAGPLVLQLIRDEQFTPEEIEQLQHLIDGLDTDGKKGRKT